LIWCNIPACGTSYYERKGCAVDMVDIAERHVFVVDDEVRVLEAIEETLGTLGVQVACFVHPAKCLERLRSDKCDLLIADLRMPEMDGIELLGNVKHHSPWVPVLIVTGYGDIPSAVQAIKAGAVDFIEKPLHKDHLLRVVESILQDGDPANKSVGRPLTAIQTRVLKLVVAGKQPLRPDHRGASSTLDGETRRKEPSRSGQKGLSARIGRFFGREGVGRRLSTPRRFSSKIA